MKIAIHLNKNTFAERWIRYCEDNDIPYKIVNAYDSNIVEKLSDCTAFMWHFRHDNHSDMFFARKLLFSLQMKELKIFPNFNTAWHYDDKVGQKYLLEAMEVPFVPTYIFYSKKEALEWIKKTDFPKVFKLSKGAGSSNVKLVKSKKEAIQITNKAFGKGISPFNRIDYFKEKYRLFKLGKDKLGLLKGIYMIFFSYTYIKLYPREKGYVYFQDFIPKNKYDIRVVVVDNKAFALKRMVRKNDFRASGSGDIIYTKSEIDERCVKIAFDVNEKIKAQSIAFDFIFDTNNNPLVVEISYAYSAAAYDVCKGYWDIDMQWHAGPFSFCAWMVDMVK